MQWNKHYHLQGKHARLSPSGYSWLNYTEDKMRSVFLNNLKKEQGTFLHDLAHRMIISRTKARDLKKALYMFVNDAIGFGMDSEVLLYYSDNCFGTADAIKYDETKKELMVFDLKTGDSKPSFKQLYIYCALFCLEYGYLKKNVVEGMTFICRIYQGIGYEEEDVDPKVVWDCMNQIQRMDTVITDVLVEHGSGLFGGN